MKLTTQPTLALLQAALWLAWTSSWASPLPEPPLSVAQSLPRGEQFLTELYDASLGLLPEYAGAKTYWLFHDNYLAAKLLDQNHPKLARTIRQSLRRYGYESSGKIELLFGEAPHPLPFRVPELMTVTQTNGMHIRTEILTERLQTSWEKYADLVFMRALVLAKPEPASARQLFQDGLAMWDGIGFRDAFTEHSPRSLYATYKLALALLTARALKEPLPMRADILAQLVRQQSSAGGWITDYDPDRKPYGLANVETTCLVMLALRGELESPSP